MKEPCSKSTTAKYSFESSLKIRNFAKTDFLNMDKSKFLKTITLTLFFLIASLSANSQIQRQILGYRLGVSQRSVVVKGLKNKGYDLDIKKDAANKGPIFYSVEGGVSFGGFIWDDVVIGFINGKFYSIMMDTYLTDVQCKKLQKSLHTKYKRYSTEHTKPSENVYDYNDGRTNCMLYYWGGHVTLMYGDEKLESGETNSSSSNDL